MQYSGFRKGVFVGLIGGLASAALVYQHRKFIEDKMWKLRIKLNLNRRLHDMKSITKAGYEELVEDITARYKTAGTVTQEEIEEFTEQLKQRWGSVKKRFEEASKEDEE